MTAPIALALLLVTTNSLGAARGGATDPVVPTSGGHVTLECVIADRGALTDCRVVDEAPLGRGLAQRALDAASKLRLEAQVVDGVAVSGLRVRIPFDFKS
jgi:TonB family protein